nr:hypothetical protein BSM_28920 [uncultured archaeon]CBH39900.1 hypothetical protein BSM_33790 [uncultured archaeon]
MHDRCFKARPLEVGEHTMTQILTKEGLWKNGLERNERGADS